jgi:hypothetical protein
LFVKRKSRVHLDHQPDPEDGHDLVAAEARILEDFASTLVLVPLPGLPNVEKLCNFQIKTIT